MGEISYRVATVDDAALAADLMSAAYPAVPQDPVMVRYRWERPRRDYSYGRFIADDEKRAIAYAAWTHGPWEKLPDLHCEVEVWLDQAALEPALLTSLWTWIIDRAIEEGAGLLLAYAGEDEPEMLESLAALGFRKDRVGKISRLDLGVHGPRLLNEAALAKSEMAGKNVELVTLASWQDPNKYAMLHELDARTRQDIPHTLPILTETLDDFVARNTAPDRPADRTWVALEAGRPVAMTYLKFPPVRGAVWTGYTCSHPDQRGRGLARAIKLQSLAQAVALGVAAVTTDNDEANLPMLHINRALGYEPRPGFVSHLKRVRSRDDA